MVGARYTGYAGRHWNYSQNILGNNDFTDSVYWFFYQLSCRLKVLRHTSRPLYPSFGSSATQLACRTQLSRSSPVASSGDHSMTTTDCRRQRARAPNTLLHLFRRNKTIQTIVRTSDNSNNRWKRLCLFSWTAAPCVWKLRALTRNLLTYLLTWSPMIPISVLRKSRN